MEWHHEIHCKECALVHKLPTFFLMPFAHAESWKEQDYVNHLCQGEIEVVLPDRTRIDCLTDDYAIEFDYGHKWAEAIGQSLYYSAQTGKPAGIYLIIDESHNGRYLARLERTIATHNLPITVWTTYISQNKE